MRLVGISKFTRSAIPSVQPRATTFPRTPGIPRWCFKEAPGICGIRGLHQNQYVYFVIHGKGFERLGRFQVLFKLHPGAWRASYFERIKEHFDLKCDVVVDGNFQDFVRESDFVIGPASSGAMPETLAWADRIFRSRLGRIARTKTASAA